MLFRSLAPAIASIVAQRLGDWRLLVLDHGSTDGSGDIVARFGAKDARIEHHFLPEAEGLGALLNEGLESVPVIFTGMFR